MTVDMRQTADSVVDRITPTLEAIDERARQARRAITQGRHAAEDAMAEAALQVRRHPLSAVVMAGAAGAMLGCMFGFAMGMRERR